jgi:glycosyltransferase involved in cell wall biosynthesis
VRILFLDQYSEFGGAQLCLRDILAEVQRRGWQAEVMAPGSGPLLSFARDCGFDTKPLPVARYANGRKTPPNFLRFGVDMARCIRAVQRVVCERPVDLIYVNGPRVLPAAIGDQAPVVFHAHSVLGQNYARAIAGRALRWTRATALACSQFAAAPLQAVLGEDNVRVVYNGAADHGFRRPSPGSGPLRVGILGRIAPEKGHLDFLHAARLLAEDSADIRFAVIGAALFSDPDYERAVRALGEASGVEFRGWTADVAGALHGLDILAVPSASVEASTRVVMEALSAGTCVVAYPSGGIPELIRTGHSGLLTDGYTPAALASAIRTLTGNYNLRARLAENGRKEWQARFTLQRFQREVCDRLAAVTGPKPFSSGTRCELPAAMSAHDKTLSLP